jgi:methionyl-tRNA formyltransferase
LISAAALRKLQPTARVPTLAGSFYYFSRTRAEHHRIKSASEQAPPAQFLVKNAQFFVGCGNNSAIELLEVQPEGKKRISARDFVHGYRPPTGERFET